MPYYPPTGPTPHKGGSFAPPGEIPAGYGAPAPLTRQASITLAKTNNKPDLARARVFVSKHHPTYKTGSGDQRSYYHCCTPTGRFCCRSCDWFDPCCEGRVSTFTEFGSGITGNFKALKLFSCMFLLMTLCTVPLLMINVNGRGRLASVNALTLSATSLGNMGFTGVAAFNATSNATLASNFLDIPGWTLVVGAGSKGMSSTMASLVYSLCDLASCLVFFLTYVWLRPSEEHEERQVNQATITADDYTIYLPTVAPDTTEEALRSHFEGIGRVPGFPCPPGTPRDFWAVDEVNIVEDDAELVQVCVARGRLSRKIDRVRERLAREEEHMEVGGRGWCGGREARVYRLKAALAREEKQYADFDAKAKARGSTNYAVAAFVTFRYQEAKDTVVEAYPEGIIPWLCQPRRLRLHAGKKGGGAAPPPTRLTVRPAPSPSSVMWENLHVTTAEKCVRVSITGIITIGLLGMSFLLLWFASWKSAQLAYASQLSDCVGVATLPLTPSPIMAHYHSKVSDATNATKYCTCAAQAWSSLSYTQITQPYATTGVLDASDCPFHSCPRWLALDAGGVWNQAFCVSWLWNRLSAAVLVVSAAVLVLMINSGLAYAMRLLTKVEGHHSYEDLNASLALRLFYASFINTGLLVVVINVAWPFVVAVSEFSTGKYSDFSTGWYDNVGTSLLTTMIINTLSPHLYDLVCAYRFCLRSRHPDLTRVVTQRDLNKSLLGPFSDPSIRFAQVFNTIFVCFTFSTGLPLMIPIAAFSMLMFYWVDKALFMWYFRKPPAYSIRLQQTMTALLPMALIMHLGVGVWMLTASGGFNVTGSALGATIAQFSDPVAAQVAALASSNASVSAGVARVANAGVLPLFIFFLFVVVWLALWAMYASIRGVSCAAFKILTCNRCSEGGRLSSHGGGWKLDTPTFLDSRRSHNRNTPRGMQGTPSYNILLNAEIMWTFNIPIEFALTHHRLADVLNFKHVDTRKSTAVAAPAPIARANSVRTPNPLGPGPTPSTTKPAAAAKRAGAPPTTPFTPPPMEESQGVDDVYNEEEGGEEGDMNDPEFLERLYADANDGEEEDEHALDEEGGVAVGIPPSFSVSNRRLAVEPLSSPASQGSGGGMRRRTLDGVSV